MLSKLADAGSVLILMHRQVLLSSSENSRLSDTGDDPIWALRRLNVENEEAK
jgi:hypothetical protein